MAQVYKNTSTPLPLKPTPQGVSNSALGNPYRPLPSSFQPQTLAIERLRKDYDIDLSNFYRLSNKDRLKLLSRKEAINVQTYQPSFDTVNS
jgi:hypothetical protein